MRKFGARPYWLGLLLGCLGILGCAVNNQIHRAQYSDELAVANRLTWGINDSLIDEVKQRGIENYLTAQLHPSKAQLPGFVNEQIANLQISQKSVDELVKTAAIYHREKKESKAEGDSPDKNYQAFMSEIARETEQRFFLRAVYSPNQLEEKMVWFWLNHFSIYSRKNDLRVRAADFEDLAIRPHALGKFKDILAATVYHPAMLLFLDNASNKKDHINENYARELMELHTLGVDAGYSQDDVQNLAKILTGLGVASPRKFVDVTEVGMEKNKTKDSAKQKNAESTKKMHQKAKQPTRDVDVARSNFEPKRHLDGPKILLGRTIEGAGQKEIDEAISILSRHPATAKYISKKLAIYFLGQVPSDELLKHMVDKFTASDGDIPSVLHELFISPEFNGSLKQAFKDPLNYILSSARLLANNQPLTRFQPFITQLDKLDQRPFGRQTPDGYPMQVNYWNGSGQMVARFDAAQQFVQRELKAMEQSNAVHWYMESMSNASRSAISAGANPKEKMQLFLSTPEFMLY